MPFAEPGLLPSNLLLLGEDDLEAVLEAAADPLSRVPVLETGRLAFFDRLEPGRESLPLLAKEASYDLPPDPADAWRFNLPDMDWALLVDRGIFDSDRGASGLPGDFVASFSCFTADFFNPAKLLSLERTGDDLMAFFAASVSAFFK